MEELFGTQIEYIKKMGFGEWIRKYPVNPLTIVGFVILVGFLILLINAKTKKSHAEEVKPYRAAVIVLKRLNATLYYLAEQVRVTEVNGDDINWFFHKTRPAIYLKPGRNRITVYAEWSQSIYKHIRTEPRTVYLKVEEDKEYTLYYLINTDQYLLVEGLQYENKEWENKLSEENIVG